MDGARYAQGAAGESMHPTATMLNHAGALRVRCSLRFASFELNVDFSAHRGTTVLFGASGAGKTATLDCIAGLRRPAEGHVARGERVLFDSTRRISLPP